MVSTGTDTEQRYHCLQYSSAVLLCHLLCHNRNKREEGGSEYYYDYGDYGAAVAALPESDRVMGSKLCQPCSARADPAAAKAATSGGKKAARPDPKLFRKGVSSHYSCLLD